MEERMRMTVRRLTPEESVRRRVAYEESRRMITPTEKAAMRLRSFITEALDGLSPDGQQSWKGSVELGLEHKELLPASKCAGQLDAIGVSPIDGFSGSMSFSCSSGCLEPVLMSPDRQSVEIWGPLQMDFGTVGVQLSPEWEAAREAARPKITVRHRGSQA